jgi:hypothetical protein
LHLGRLFILILVSTSSFVIGVLAADFAEWEKFIGPLAISMSALLATLLAVKNIEQGRRHELVRRTHDILDRKPIKDRELINFRNRMNHRINSMELYKKPIDEKTLGPMITSLKSGETNIARSWLKYISRIYIGIQDGLYDKQMIEKDIGTLPINVWREFWPIAKYQDIKMRQINEGHEFGGLSEYWAVEVWATELSRNKDLTREKPMFSYKPLDEDGDS